MAATLKREVLQLYAGCLRSARKCPEWKQREIMKTYVKMKFRDEVATRDPGRICQLLADGRDELARMDYYHSVYEQKKRAETAAMEASVTRSRAASDAGGKEASRAAVCAQCEAVYPSPEANFCANCGAKRPPAS